MPSPWYRPPSVSTCAKGFSFRTCKGFACHYIKHRKEYLQDGVIAEKVAAVITGHPTLPKLGIKQPDKETCRIESPKRPFTMTLESKRCIIQGTAIQQSQNKFEHQRRHLFAMQCADDLRTIRKFFMQAGLWAAPPGRKRSHQTRQRREPQSPSGGAALSSVRLGKIDRSINGGLCRSGLGKHLFDNFFEGNLFGKLRSRPSSAEPWACASCRNSPKRKLYQTA
jgi:hypothetical protein